MAAGDKSAIYRDLMRFKPEGITPNGWATKAGVSRTVWSDMRRHGNPSRRTLEKLLTAAGSSLAEFEALRVGDGPAREGVSSGLADPRAGPWGAHRLPSLPLLRTVMGGDWAEDARRIELIELRTDELLDQLPRPVTLANDPTAYAITIVGDSMWPRFRPGRRLAVSARLPIAIGDDVLVKLKGSEGSAAVPVLVKELVRTSGAGIELRQFNPNLVFEVPAAEIVAIEKVVGEVI